MVPVAILPIGYPKEGTKPSESHFKRKDIKEMVEYLKDKNIFITSFNQSLD